MFFTRSPAITNYVSATGTWRFQGDLRTLPSVFVETIRGIFLSWEVGPSPVVFVATQLGVFKGFSGLFQLRLLRPNLEYLSWEVEPSPALFMAKEPVVLRETSGHFLAGFGATKIVHFSRKVEPFSAVLVETVFYAKS